MNTFFEEKDILLITNILSATTFGTPAVKDCYKTFIIYQKQAALKMFIVQCIIHLQHLIVTNMNAFLHALLDYILYEIRDNSLTDTLFSQHSSIMIKATIDCFFEN